MSGDEEIAGLLREGRHREAAELLVERGELHRAMEAYAAVWDYEKAAEVALAAGDVAAALDYSLRAGDRAAAVELRPKLAEGPKEQVERAVSLLVARGEKEEAARLLEASGELERAASLAEELGDRRRAASLLERAGKAREAGRIYERLVMEDPNDAVSALALGRILRRYGKLDAAARMLQSAAKHRRQRRAALYELVPTLHALGYEEAAKAALEQLRQVDGAAPRTVAALVALDAESDAGPGRRDEQGQWIDARYEVLKVLGGGAAGRVYLARDALYDREVAVKVLAVATDDGAGRDAFTRFAREAEIASRLQHPNIVRVLDFDRASGVLVMEYLGGGTLADRLTGRPLPLALVKDVLFGLLGALEVAHLRGVIHRDIKPQNVLFDRGGGVKLGDFGVAHLQDLGLTQTGAFIGTLTYMAPEQITGAPLSAATDLYGLGATIYHALCGRPPFVGADLIRQHLSEIPEPPSRLRPALGSRFDAIMAKLLAKSPEERFRSAAEVRRAAEEIDFSEPEHEVFDSDDLQPPEPVEAGAEEAELFIDVSEPEDIPGGERRLATHRRLELPVYLDRLTNRERLDRLASLGRAVSPRLQCVLDLDRESGEAVLERPRGIRLDEHLSSRGRLELSAAVELCRDVGRALGALHAVGESHGEVGPEAVYLSELGAWLTLPEAPVAGSGQSDDARALLSLFLAVTGSAEPADLEARLVEAVGPGRFGSLGLPPGLGPGEEVTVADTLEWLGRAREALEQRRRAREHLHALAASVRARGVDPRRGAVAAYLRQRAMELEA